MIFVFEDEEQFYLLDMMVLKGLSDFHFISEFVIWLFVNIFQVFICRSFNLTSNKDSFLESDKEKAQIRRDVEQKVFPKINPDPTYKSWRKH